MDDIDAIESKKTAKLQCPIDINDLLSGKLTEFALTKPEDEDEGSDIDEEDVPYDESRNIVMDNSIGEPFATMKLQMVPIHYGLYKQILTEGTGDIVPPTARVKVDFNSFWEGDTTPFQSTFLDRRPSIFTIGQDQTAGFYYAIISMRTDEVAQFIIPYQHLYGELGIPCNGYPPKADGHFIIRLISFQDVGDSNAINDSCIESFDKYEEVLERVVEVRKSARAFFSDKKYASAVEDFKKCIVALKFCWDPKQEERAELLSQLYVNLCVCYNKLDQPKDVLEVAKDLQSLGKFDKNCKALFQMGRAHFKLSDYKEALKYFEKAQRLEPNNKEIAEEMRLVNDDNLQYKKAIKEISEMAIQKKKDFVYEKPNVKPIAKNSPMIAAMVKRFVNNDKATRQMLPLTLSELELEEITSLATEHNLRVVAESRNNETWRFLTKEK